MITINLLPAEYRKSEATPIGRFIAIIVGAVIVTTGLVAYGYIHYSKLKGVRDVREATEAEYANAKARADVSRNLQAEVNAYSARRKAIQEIVKNRILHSRKLDEYLDIIHNNGDHSSYFVWLDGLTVTPPREVRRGKVQSGGEISFEGYAESASLSRVTNVRDAIRKDPFFQDFQSISMPNFKSVYWQDGLEPSSAGRFGFSMTLKPLDWRHSAKKR